MLCESCEAPQAYEVLQAPTGILDTPSDSGGLSSSFSICEHVEPIAFGARYVNLLLLDYNP